MLHGSKTRKLGRKKNQREALLRTLSVSLVKHGRIETSEAKAKELRPFIERLITKARREDLTSRRNVISALGNEESAKKLFIEIAPKYKNRKGGYTRIVKTPSRQGDASRRAIIEFV